MVVWFPIQLLQNILHVNEIVLLRKQYQHLQLGLSADWSLLLRPSDENGDDQQRRQDAATVFRGRHHISQDDTRNNADEFEEVDLLAETSGGAAEEVAVRVAEVCDPFHFKAGVYI